MGFLFPALLGMLCALPIILAYYFLKLRRQPKTVASTWLWQVAAEDRQANRPWQRIRPSLLLLLQLLAALLLAVAVSHPFRWLTSPVAGSTVILLDASANMQATDVAPSRFATAQVKVRDWISQLPPGSDLSLVLVSRTPEILLAHATDRSQLRAALAKAAPTAGDGDLSQAMALASSLLQGRKGRIVLLSGGHLQGLEDLPPAPAPVTYEPIGAPDAANLAVSAFATRNTPTGLVALAQVQNFGPADAPASIQFLVDGKVTALAQATVPKGGTHPFSWPVPTGARLLQVHLAGQDTLALDDAAWTLVGGAQAHPILLVTAGNPFLQQALTLLPGAKLTVQKPDEYKGADTHDLVVFDGWLPAQLPAVHRLIVAPPAGSAYVSGGLEPLSGLSARPGESLLRYVDTSDVHVATARRAVLPDDAHLLWAAQTAKGDLPLLWTRERGAEAEAVLNFDLHDSDLPLRTAFPILVQNLGGWLLPGDPVGADLVRPGATLHLHPWPGAQKLTFEGPDGQAQTFVLQPDSPAPLVTFDQPGLYAVRQELPSGARSAQVAVNLFSPVASNLAPVEKLFVATTPQADAAPTRAPYDLWVWVAALALLAILSEWWVDTRGYAR